MTLTHKKATKPLKPIASTIAAQMTIIVTMSLFVICIAIVTLTYSLRDAEVINVSGSMRMQSYRLSNDLFDESRQLNTHIKSFEDSIHSPTMQSLYSLGVPHHIQAQYSGLTQQWEDLSKLLASENKLEYLNEVDGFVEQIDHFVYTLQEFSENKLKMLSMVGGTCLFIILFCAIRIVRFVRRDIVRPLEDLVVASEQLQSKQFNIKLQTGMQTELGVLATTYQKMAFELKNLYHNLESLVDKKTAALQNANQSLALLYQSSESISAARLTTSHFKHIIEQIQTIDGVSAVQLVIHQSGEGDLHLETGQETQNYWQTYPLKQGDLYLGMLKWQYLNQAPDRGLIENLGRLIARGLYFEQGQKRAEQVILMEERATIARELHDSLAQSLSYLKIQVVLLKRNIAQSDCNKVCAPAESIVLDIEDVLSNAYIQLRELLNTFRLSIEEADFGIALQQILEPLKKQTSAEFLVNNQLSSIEISAAKQVHLLQFIREACLNAINHAKARTISVDCLQQDDSIKVMIQDDGIGFHTEEEKPNHYGLTIMHERANRLNAQCQIKSQPGHGCQVNLVMNLSIEEN